MPTLDVSDSEAKLIVAALKAYTGETEQPIMGGKLPPAVVHPEPEDLPGQADYPPKGNKTQAITMTSTKKELGGEEMKVPEAGTVPAKSEEKPSAKPGDGEFAGAKAPESTGKVTEEGSGTGPTDKPSFKPTVDKDEETMKSKASKKEEDDEGADSLLDRIKSGKKAEEDWKKLRAKMDEALAPVPTPAAAAPAPKPAPAPAPGPMAAPVPPAPGMKAEEDEEEAYKALKNIFWSIVSKGGKPEEMLKEYDSVLSQVFQPKGGAENLTNLRSPGQPPAKIAASPGQSGSSGVVRTETGAVGDKDALDERAKTNPPGTLETEQNVPVGTYDKETFLTSGTGYQMPLLRNAAVSQFKGKRTQAEKDAHTIEHPSYTEFKARESGKVSKDSTPSMLKHIQSDRIPTAKELELMVKEGLVTEELLAKAETPEENPDAKGSVLMKGLTRFRRA